MLRQILRVALGLALAVLAGLAVGAALGLPLVAEPAAFEPPLWTVARAAIPYLPLVFVLSLTAIAAAEARGYRHWLYWLLVGGAISGLGFFALRVAGLPADTFAGRAPLKFGVMGAAGGLVYWLFAGWASGGLKSAASHLFGHAELSEREERSRCVWCVVLTLLLGMLPLAVLGWHAIHKSDQRLAMQITSGAENEAGRLFQAVGLSDLSLRIDDHIGHVEGTAANVADRERAFNKAAEAITPMVGVPGIVAILQNDIVALDDTEPQVAAENARIRAAMEDARRAAALAEDNRKAEEARIAAVAEARRKAEEETARKAAEEARLAAEAEAKRKAEEDAARKAAEEARLAAEAETKRKAEEEAARKVAEEARLAAEAEAKRQAEAEARRKAEEEAARNAAEAARLATEAEAKRRAEADARRKIEEEAARQAVEEARLAAETATRRRAEEEARRKAEIDAARKAEIEAARQRAEETVRQKAVAEQAARLRAMLETCNAEIKAAGRIYFRLNRADLKRRHSRLLDKIAEISDRCPELTLVVSGHTDQTGPADYNERLSAERAEAVRAALIERGVASKLLLKLSFAARRPVDGTYRSYAHAKDRRAEFAFIHGNRMSGGY